MCQEQEPGAMVRCALAAMEIQHVTIQKNEPKIRTDGARRTAEGKTRKRIIDLTIANALNILFPVFFG